MGKSRAVIFDLDDTLYPERAYVLSGFRAVSVWTSVELGMEADEVFIELIGIHDQGERNLIFNRWLECHGKPIETLLPRMIGIYRNHRPVIKPYEDVPELLQSMRRSFLLGLLTDGFGSVQRLKLEATELGGFFDEILFTDDLGRESWKPSLRPFEIIVARLGVAPSEAVYIGDNPQKDFFGPRSIGMKTVRIRREGGYHTDEEPPSPEYAPHISVTGLERLGNELDKVFTA